MKKQLFLLPIISTSSFLPAISCNQNAKYQFDTLLSSYKQMLIETINTSEYGDWTIDQIMSCITPEQDTEHFSQPCTIYKFNNIDYADGDRAIWPAHQHIVRALAIAIAAEKEQNKEISEQKMDIANKLILYWLCHKFENSNWWFNEIGVPRDLSNVAIFLKDKLTFEQQDKLMEWIHHGSFKYAEATRSYTGTNTFWASDITMKSACLTKDEEEMEIMFDYLGKEIKIDAEEGFQSDGTYFQHNQLLYTGGYGRQGALLLAKIASAFNDCDLKLDEEKLSIIVNFALDGMKYMTHKGNFTWQCMGRTYTRKQASQYSGGITDLGNITEMKYIANLPNCPRKDELNSLIHKWSNNESNFNGIKFFPTSQFIAANYDGIYIGLKGTKENLINAEMGNGENQLGHNLAFGFNTCIMQSGKEYDNVSPVWNYSYIPGTVSIDEDDATLKFYDNDEDARRKIEGPCYGAIDDEQNVAFISQKGKENFRQSKKSKDYKGAIEYMITSFACDDGVAILGTNINNTTGNEMHATVDQFAIDTTNNINYLDDEKSVINNNVIYSNIVDGEDYKLHLERKTITQPWSRNNESYGDEEITKTISTITINNPSLEKYAYSIQPKSNYMSGKRISVVKNDNEAQAILMPNKKIACIFWQDSSFEYEGVTYSGNVGEFKIFTTI